MHIDFCHRRFPRDISIILFQQKITSSKGQYKRSIKKLLFKVLIKLIFVFRTICKKKDILVTSDSEFQFINII